MMGAKRLAAFAAVFLAAAAVLQAAGGADMGGTAHGNGDVVAQERQARGFERVELRGMGSVRIRQGEDYRVVVTMDSNLQERVDVSVARGTLVINVRQSQNLRPTRFEIDVYMPDLREVILSDAAKAPTLDMRVSGAGNADAQNARAGAVSVGISGAGNVRAWATDTLRVRISGTGSVARKGEPRLDFRRSGLGWVSSI